jgi:hypothetical protein
MAEDRRRLAYHEAAHGVVDLFYGREVEYLSIRPGRSHGGVARSRVPDQQRIDLDALLGPEVLLTDSGARLLVERAIVSVLAGQAAAELVDMQTGRLEDVPPLPAAVAAAEALATLSPRHRELLFASEARDDPIDDDDRAFEFSYWLAGQEANLHIAWLRQVANRMVRERWAAISAVAKRLLVRGVLSGAEVAQIVNGERP